MSLYKVSQYVYASSGTVIVFVHFGTFGTLYLEELLLLISSFMNFYLKLVAILLQRSQKSLFYPINTTVGSRFTFLHS